MLRGLMTMFGIWVVTSVVCARPTEVSAPAPGFNPIPKLGKLPTNVSTAWLLRVYEEPEKFGLDEWIPAKKDLSDSGRLAYSIDFTSSYPIDKQRLRAAAPGLKINWLRPRVQQSLSLELWNDEPSEELKKESPWISPGRLTWTLVNFVYECAIPGRIYRVALITVDARTQRQLERRIDNEMLEMDYTNSWDGVCDAKSG